MLPYVVFLHPPGFAGVWIAHRCSPGELRRAEEAAWQASLNRWTELLLERMRDVD